MQEHQKSGSNEIASGMPLLVTAADRRARAVYYSFTLVCIGLAVLLVVILVESHRWRTTITNESAVSLVSSTNLISLADSALAVNVGNA